MPEGAASVIGSPSTNTSPSTDTRKRSDDAAQVGSHDKGAATDPPPLHTATTIHPDYNHEEDDDLDEDNEHFDRIFTYVTRGEVAEVEAMALAGHVNIAQNGSILELADEAGTLTEFLKRFPQLPLVQYPHLAQSHLKESVKHLKDMDSRDWRPAMNLLANYLMIPNSCADKMMEGCWEEMVVYGGTGGLKPDSKAMHFPDTLGAIFLQRTLKERYASDIRYQKQENGGLVKFTPGGSNMITSVEYPITLSKAVRKAALIPLRATSFTYVQGKLPDFPVGGFLYIGKDGRPVAVNQITFHKSRYALKLAKFERLDAQASNDLYQRGFDITVADLREKGAIKYAWVGPSEKLSKNQKAGPAGGFAYLFERREDGKPSNMDRLFNIEGAAEVVDRAQLNWNVNTALLDESATGDTIEHKLTKSISSATARSRKSQKHTRPHNRQDSPVQSLNAKDDIAEAGLDVDVRQQANRDRSFAGVPVNIGRMRFPGFLHPVLIHALSVTPRNEVLSTVPAQALATAAYMRARPSVLQAVALELGQIICLFHVATLVREPGIESPSLREARIRFDWTPSFIAGYGFITAIWVKNVWTEVRLYRAFCQRGWKSSYWSGAKYMSVLHYMLMAFAVSVLAIDREWTREQTTIRPLLAVVGCMKWFRILFQASGFSVFQLGLRILPILHALREAVSVVLVMLVFLFACAHVSYGLSDLSWDNLLFTAYRIGFLGDFDTNQDVLFLKKKDPHNMCSPWEEKAPWQSSQYIAFVFFSFVISVAMTNIFIGIMSNAFDAHQERVLELFIRMRADIGLNYALLNSTPLEEKYIWFCYRRSERDEGAVGEADEALDLGNSGNSLHGAVKNLKNGIQAKCDKLTQQLDQQSEKTAALGESLKQFEQKLLDVQGTDKTRLAKAEPETSEATPPKSKKALSRGFTIGV